MRLPHLIISLGLFVFAARGEASRGEKDPAAIIRELQRDPSGFKHISDDGIVRSFDGNGDIIDFARLSHDQLMEIADWPSNADIRDHLLSGWDGVDGWSIELDQILNPPPHLLPSRRNREDDGLEMSIDMRRAAKAIRGLKLPEVFCYGYACQTHGDCSVHGCSECVEFRRKKTYCNP